MMLYFFNFILYLTKRREKKMKITSISYSIVVLFCYEHYPEVYIVSSTCAPVTVLCGVNRSLHGLITDCYSCIVEHSMALAGDSVVGCAG